MKHETEHERIRDEVERAFWRLNDYCHGNPSMSSQANTVHTWQCACGTFVEVQNGGAGFNGHLLVRVTTHKANEACPLVGEKVAALLERWRTAPDELVDRDRDKRTVEAAGREIEGTLSSFCEQIAAGRREARREEASG